MELKEKDKLFLLYEETTNLIPESNKINKEKLEKVDSTLNSKLTLVNNIIKDHNIDIKKFKNWINTINKNETEIKQYTSLLEEISNKLDTTLTINKFEYDIQEKTIHTLNEQYNLLKTLQIRQEKQKKHIKNNNSNLANKNNIKNPGIRLYEENIGHVSKKVQSLKEKLEEQKKLEDLKLTFKPKINDYSRQLVENN